MEGPGISIRTRAVLQRARRLSDWPLIVKFAIAPALSLAFLLAMAFIEIAAGAEPGHA